MKSYYSDEDFKKRIVIVAGGPRCGSTFLHYHLRNHPNFFMPYYKEIDFFCYHYHIGIENYLRNFKPMAKDMVGFDISPGYVVDQENNDKVIQRIKGFNPNVKVILGVRNPVDFAVSNYLQIDKYLYWMPPFEEFVKNFKLKLGYNRINMNFKTMVFDVLEKYKKAFGKNLLIYNFEVVKKDPLILLNAIENFVGVQNYFNKNTFINKRINASNNAEIKLVYFLKAWLKSHRIPKVSNSFTDKLNRISLINPFRVINKSRKEKAYKNIHSKYYDIAKDYLSEEDKKFYDIFSRTDIQLGNGEAYNLPIKI
jgi:hypothetical protein